MGRVVFFGCVFLARVGLGEAIGQVAVHPLALVEGGEEELSELQALFAAEVSSIAVRRAPEGEVEKALAASGSCAERKEAEECLGALARATKSTHALMVTLSLYSPELVLTGKLVRPDGLARAVSSKYEKKGGGERASSVRRAIRRFLLEEVQVAEPDVVAPLVVGPPAEEEKAEPSREPLLSRRSGLYLGGAGAVLAGAGAFMLSLAAASWAEHDRFYANGGPLPSEEALFFQVRERAKAQQTMGLVALGAGAAAFLVAVPFAFGEKLDGAGVAVGVAGDGMYVKLKYPLSR